MKKVFIISLSFFIVTLLLWGAYILFFKNNPYSAEAPTDIKSISQPEDEPKPDRDLSGVNIFTGDVIKKVIEEEVLGATFDKEGKILWHVAPKSPAIKKTDIFSGITTTAVELAYEPSFVRWSPDKTRALVQEKSSGMERWHMIDLGNKSDTPLKGGMMTPVWTNIGDRIVYKYQSEDGKIRTIDTADPDGKNWKTLASISTPAPVVLAAIPQSSLIAMWNLPGAFFETALQTVSLAGGELDTILKEKFGADYLFSPKGDRIVASATNKKGGGRIMLNVSNVRGGEYRALGIPTFVGKAVWAGNGETLYYALPGDFPEETVLPDDYKNKPVYTQDTFWSVDVTTGQQNRIVDLSDLKEGYDATNLFLDPQEQYLLFINRKDGRLYRIKL